MRKHCSKAIDVELLLDSSEYVKTTAAFAMMSKCKAEMERQGDHYILKIKGAMCSCS